MKLILIIVLSLSPLIAVSDPENYNDIIFTMIAKKYWCKYKSTPRSLKDIEKITDNSKGNPEMLAQLNKWLKGITITSKNNEVIISWVTEQQIGETVLPSTQTVTGKCI